MSNTTKQEIMDSCIKMLSTEKFSKISVKDIVKKCNINRKTFYYYFTDKYSLVTQYIASELKKSMGLSEDFTEEQLLQVNWDVALKSILRFFYENKSLVQNIYTSLLHTDLEEMLFNIIEPFGYYNICLTAKTFKVADSELKVIAGLVSDVVASSILRWIKNGMVDDPIKIVDHHTKLLQRSIGVILENAEKLS